MTDLKEVIEELRQKLENATPGPWVRTHNEYHDVTSVAAEDLVCEFYYVREEDHVRVSFDNAEVDAELIVAAVNALPALLDRIAELETLTDKLRLEAECHAQEARTQKSTVYEIYQLVSGATGEPGDWKGATPVRERLEADAKRIAELEGRLQSVFDTAGAAHLEGFADGAVKWRDGLEKIAALARKPAKDGGG